MLKKEAIVVLEEYLSTAKFGGYKTYRDLPPPLLERIINRQLSGKHVKNIDASELTVKIAITDYLSHKRFKAGYLS